KRNILKSLLFTLKNQTDESKRHIKNVEKISLALGAEIGLSAIELNKLSLLAVVHDIGKITISKDILNKPGSLTAKERKLINKHPEKGHQIISSSQDLSFIATSLLHHHENWDGSGYPLGLEKYDIPLPSRIIHLAISYDAMAHGRVYKKAMEQKEIIVELQDKSGSQFDPTLVPNLIKLIKENNINYPVNKISRRLSLINDFLN
ncbi:MAG: HD-GYP domain-containing protein, partial [Bacillota bacterium]